MEISGIAAIIAYLGATALQLQNILKGSEFQHAIRLTVLAAILAHAVTAYLGFHVEGGYDLSLYPMLSLIALAIVVTVMISSLQRPVDNLFIVIFPFALLTVLLELLFHGEQLPRYDLTPGIFSHIILSVTAYSLLTVAAAQAVLLSLGDNLLRQHQLVVLRNMPPLETMEQLMFEMLWIGLIFLTMSIASGFLFLEDISGPGLVHHTVITLAAWIVFSVLMWGRYQLGWRGAIASRWTLSGFALLVLGYFGSKLVLEIIIGSA